MAWAAVVTSPAPETQLQVERRRQRAGTGNVYTFSMVMLARAQTQRGTPPLSQVHRTLIYFLGFWVFQDGVLYEIRLICVVGLRNSGCMSVQEVC